MTAGEDGNTTALKGLTPTREQFMFGPMFVLFGFEYPTVLRQELTGRYTTQASVISVANRGLPGEALAPSTTLIRFATDVLNTDRQVVLIMEGSNDLYDEYYAPSTAAGAAIESAALNNLLTMLTQAKSRNIRPYVATVPPANPAGFRGHLVYTFVDGFNQKIRQVAQIQNVPLVDVNAAFRGDLSLLSSDGYHPNAAGYQRIADTFFDAIQNTLEIR
jgi:lysophospholipase L1-like esterase